MKISIENSDTPIYRRIIHCLARGLETHGHQAIIDNPKDWDSIDHYLQSLEERKIDISLITNLHGVKACFLQDQGKFVFEILHHQLAFLHHDHYATCPVGAKVENLLNAYQSQSHRSHHFCIESSNCDALSKLGLANVHFIHHATEFSKAPLAVAADAWVSFVGHVLDPAAEYRPTNHWLLRDYWTRVCDLTHHVQPSAAEYACRTISRQDLIPLLAAESDYLATLHTHSLIMRGDVLKRAGSNPLHIYGGDPAYLQGMDLHRKLPEEHVFYHHPQHNPREIADIYNKSAVSINITPLQFDSAVINRVLDIGAAGGFPLTDWKEDLARVTSVSEEISYKCPEELEHKIAYYSHPDHRHERLEICHCLSSEIQENHTYEQITAYLLAKLQDGGMATTSKNAAEAGKAPVNVDLGCGNHKPPGFIGVDRFPSPAVDSVADLTRRFPFATSSVDAVRAHDIIEHLPDRIHTMNEIWRICKHMAVVDIRVPSSDGRGAFQDPTHVSYWNANSFQYYSPQFPAYHQLCKTYGFKGAFAILSLDEEISSDKVIHLQVQLQAIKPGHDHDDMSKLLAELRTANLLFEVKPFTGQSYCNLKSLISSILVNPKSSEIAVFVSAGDMSSEEEADMLIQLMLDLLSDGCVSQESNLPHIGAAPRDPELIRRLLPSLAYRGPLDQESMQQALHVIQSTQS